MQKINNYEIIVIGAGAGGLVVAIGAARAGKKVLLVEKGNYGGDCTNFGCIPSKSLIASAHAAFEARHASSMGIKIGMEQYQPEGVLERVRRIVSDIRSHEEPAALKAKGVPTITGKASFIDAHTLSIASGGGISTIATGDQIVIAAGSHPVIPEIAGIENVPYLTNETVFELQEVPESLTVIGGGPIGCELAQAFRRLGSKVAIIQRSGHLLHKEEQAAEEVIENRFREEGIEVFFNAAVHSAKYEGGMVILSLSQGGSRDIKEVKSTHLLISAGRRPSIEGMSLEKAGIEFNAKGIIVDAYGRTTQKNVWAVGDVTGRAIFTHVAENEARTVLSNLILPWPLRFKIDSKQPIPRVTYTDPEVASLGLSEEEAIKEYGQSKIAAYFVSMKDVDRAITAGRTEGFVKIVTKKWSGKILGCTIVAPRAGEMLLEVGLAMHNHIPLRKLAGLIHPYPTYSQAIRKAADQWLLKTILPFFKSFTSK